MGRAIVKDRNRYVVVETVSGHENNVTPSFKTKAELSEFLYTYGEWGGDGPVSKEQADAFCKSGYVPSFIVTKNKMLSNYECATTITKKTKKKKKI